MAASQTLFNKQLDQITIQDIENYFLSDKIETDRLEFKSYVNQPQTRALTKNADDKQKLDSIIKTICAFLNSEGGIIIWGAPVQNAGQPCKGPLSMVDITYEKDSLINQITDQISPRTNLIKIKILERAGKYCYVFEVGQSEYRPHQYKGTYYFRLDGQTRPAPHHYIEALIKRVNYPKLNAVIRFGNLYTSHHLIIIPMQVHISNESAFVNEKNIEYRLLSNKKIITRSTTKEMLSATGELLQHLTGTDTTIKAKEILHKNVPIAFDHYLFSERNYSNKPLVINIMLSVFGELSPALCSDYELTIYQNNKYSIEKSEENYYMYERSESIPGTDKEKKNLGYKILLQNLESDFVESNFYKNHILKG